MKSTLKLLFLLLITLITVFIASCKKNQEVVTPESNKIWTKAFGGNNSDVAVTMIPSYDGYLVFGHTNSYGAGNDDAFAMKLNENGDVIWMKTYGSSGFDVVTSASVTSDGNYIIVGTTTSFSAQLIDIFTLKIDENGNIIWSRYYKMTGNDYSVSVHQTDDDGYAIAGFTDSYGAGSYDVLLLKVDSLGNIEFGNTFGGAWNDAATSMVYFDGGGFNIAGYTYSAGTAGDIMLLSVGPEGDLYWAKTYGGEGIDQANNILITNDGIATNGLMMAGYTQSFGLTSGDAYVIKTDINGYLQWSKTMGGNGMDQVLSIIQVNDGGYLAAGFSNSFGAGANDAYKIRWFGDGNFKWAKVYGTTMNEQCNAINEFSDRSIISAGIKEIGTTIYDFTISRIQEDGSACGDYTAVTPSGGDPATIVSETNSITQTSVSSYETVNADFIENPVSISNSLICKNP